MKITISNIPDFSPLTQRDLNLLEELKAKKNNLQALSEINPEFDEKLRTIKKEIDDISVKLLRSGAIKRGPDKLYHFPPEALAWAKKKKLDKPQIQHSYHPQLPDWAKEHLAEWIQMQRLRENGRETIRRTGVIGLETGMKRPRDLKLFFRVLELRDVKETDDSDLQDDHIPDSFGEALDKSLRVLVTDEMLRNARRQGEVEEKKKKRIRKEGRSWKWVINKLVEEGLVNKVKTPSGHEKNPSVQAFKKMLKNRYSFHPWDET